MHGSLKLLFAVLTYLIFSSAPAIAQDDFLQNIIEKRNKPKQMQSITVSAPKAKADDDTAEKSEEEKTASRDTTEKKKDEQLWENYKRISTEDLTDKKETEEASETKKTEKVASASSQDKKAKKAEKEEQQPEEEGELIKGVLEEYKKLNGEKSTIGQRSFGDIGW